MATPYERISRARARLLAAGIPAEDAALDAEVLARHVLGCDRATLLIQGREPAPPGFDHAFDRLVDRRVAREPVAQIVGHREFWGLEFEVTRDVLIPRPETEIIVEEAAAFARETACDAVIDVGTGSGCIAISVAHELPAVRVVATDNSEAALNVASRNAQRHGVADRIDFRRSDLLENAGTADLILANPPYLAAADADSLQPEVARFEPQAALFGGDDGLAIVRRLLRDAVAHLAPRGRLIVEFGIGQERGIRDAAAAGGWTVVAVRHDLQGIPRTAILNRERTHV